VAVEEQQIEVEVVLAHTHSLLSRNEGEARTQLQQHAFDLAQHGAFEVALAVGARQAQQIQQMGIAEHGVGAHSPFTQFVDLGRDVRIRLLRQSGALEAAQPQNTDTVFVNK
jgi:hypothetical protein